MKILALEFSSPQRSVAVRKEEVATRSHSWAEVIETGAKDAQPLVMVEAALRQAQVEREEIDCLAIGLGPGSYNGIRGTIALAQGWQLARDVRLLGVSSADVLAAEALSQGLTGPVGVVIDAQRNEFYVANYQLDTLGFRQTKPLRLATLSAITELDRSGTTLIGPELTKWFPSRRLMFPRAATLGQLALGRTDFISGEKLEPIYLRETSFVRAPPPRFPGAP
jgi:tRNA threonylcarbamoyl adenosine modification protein YeaZ